MNMTKEEVNTRLCDLISLVGEEVYKNQLPHDCFCGVNQLFSRPVIDSNVLEFVEMAVYKAIRESK